MYLCKILVNDAVYVVCVSPCTAYAHVSKVGKPNIHDQACETFHLGEMGQTNPITTFFLHIMLVIVVYPLLILCNPLCISRQTV